MAQASKSSADPQAFSKRLLVTPSLPQRLFARMLIQITLPIHLLQPATIWVNPAGDLGILDLYPKVGMLSETPIQTSSFDGAFTESSRDYNGDLHNELIRGAYAGEGVNPGWLPKLERKPQPHDDIPPSPPTGLKIRVF
jgi:hypothetical protein